MEDCNDCLPVGFYYDNIIFSFLYEISNETLERHNKSTTQSFAYTYLCQKAPRKFVYSEIYSFKAQNLNV
jgi:hypothetical protein